MARMDPYTEPGPFGKRYANYYTVPCPACQAAPANYCAPDRETMTDVGPVPHESRRQAWRDINGSDKPR